MKKTILFFIAIFQILTIKGDADTIVAIHGFVTDWRSMIPVKKTLSPCGFDIFLWEYDSRRKYIEEHAVDLVVALQRIASAYPGRPIHFVTHSIGALILRVAINQFDCPVEAKMGRAVLLAPPNQGSILGRRFKDIWPINMIMGTKSGWELRNYCPREVTCLGEFPESMDLFVIAGTKGNKIFFSTTNDGFVVIPETRLNTPHRFKCFRVSHSNIIKNQRVLCATKKFIYEYYYPEPEETED